MTSSACQEAEPEPLVAAKTEAPAPVARPPVADAQIAAMQSQVSTREGPPGVRLGSARKFHMGVS